MHVQQRERSKTKEREWASLPERKRTQRMANTLLSSMVQCVLVEGHAAGVRQAIFFFMTQWIITGEKAGRRKRQSERSPVNHFLSRRVLSWHQGPQISLRQLRDVELKCKHSALQQRAPQSRELLPLSQLGQTVELLNKWVHFCVNTHIPQRQTTMSSDRSRIPDFTSRTHTTRWHNDGWGGGKAELDAAASGPQSRRVFKCWRGSESLARCQSRCMVLVSESLGSSVRCSMPPQVGSAGTASILVRIYDDYVRKRRSYKEKKNNKATTLLRCWANGRFQI